MSETIELDLSDFDAEALLADVEQSTRGRGKATQVIDIYSTRELHQADLDAVASAKVGVATAPTLQNIRASHHRIAKMIAQGVRLVEISRITGYSPGRLTVLKDSPAFADLVAQYSNMVSDAFADTVAKMKDVTDTALQILDERLSDEPESFSNGMLVDVVTKIGDRAGYAPVQKTASVSIPLDADILTSIKEKVRSKQNGSVTNISQSPIDADYEVVQGTS